MGLDEFLECYVEHIDNFEALSFILSLLPDALKYVFVRNLLKYEEFVVDGDLHGGVAPEGVIGVCGDSVVLYHEGLSGGFVVLLDLPPAHEIY